MEEERMKCEICDKIFINKNDLIVHSKSYNHLQKEKSQRAIFISRVSCDISIDEIIRFISQFGKIRKYDVTTNDGFNNVTIEFNDKETRETVLSKTIIMSNKQLYIYPWHFYDKQADQTHGIRYDEISAVFNSESSFDDQLQAFIKAVAITDEDVKKRYQPVCETLDRLFQTTLSKCKCYMFGSMVTGLGFRSSDLDIYLNTGIPVVEENTCVSGPHVITVDRLFVIIENVLRSNKHFFSSCCLIRQAKMPIIKCFYLPTKVRCDISFINSLALYNSKLVHCYLSNDIRFKPVMMLIKYWLQNYEMNYPAVGITNYAMTMLFIFYLQQVKLVPPVIKLQQECAVPIFVKGWQVNFKGSTRLNAKNEYTNKSIPEILGEFFKFYANYDFKTQVLCPIDGQSYSKESFNEGKCLSQGLMKYINYLKEQKDPQELPVWKPLCLQDPIELNNNLTKNVHSGNLEKLQSFFSIAAKIVHASSENSYTDLLKNLFNVTNCTLTYNKIKRESISLLIRLSELLTTSKDLNLMKDMFNNNKNWFDITLNLVKQILEKVLNFKVKVDKTETNPEAENVTVLHCKGNERLWFKRKDIKLHRCIANALEKEICISKQLLNDVEKKKDVTNVIIDVECHIMRKKTPNDHIVIIVYDNGCSGKIFNEFANYFIVITPSLLKKVFANIRRDASFYKNL